MMKKTLFLALALSASTAAIAHTNPYHKFYFGVNTGASFVTNQSYDNYRTNIEQLENLDLDYHFINREECSARGYNGGLMVGYNFYCNGNIMLGVEASANLYTNRGHFTDHFAKPTSLALGNWEFSHDMNYSFHLTAHPSFVINNCTTLYFNMGLGYANLNFKTKDLYTEFLADYARNYSYDESAYGFTVGAGLQKRITACVGVFAEYQYTHYGKVCLDDVPRRDQGPALRAYSNRDATIQTSVFKMGLVFTM